MKLLVLYRPQGEHARDVEEYVREFIRLNPDRTVELRDADSAENIALAELYDIVSYPALLVVDGEGKLQNLWAGADLPLKDDVSGYLNA